MHNSRWKSTERTVAKKLGGERVPVSGRQRGAAPDCTSAGGLLSVEVKDRKALPKWISEAMEQAIAGQRENQIPIVVLHERGMRANDNLVMIRLGDWVDLFGNLRTTEGF